MRSLYLGTALAAAAASFGDAGVAAWRSTEAMRRFAAVMPAAQRRAIKDRSKVKAGRCANVARMQRERKRRARDA